MGSMGFAYFDLELELKLAMFRPDRNIVSLDVISKVTEVAK